MIKYKASLANTVSMIAFGLILSSFLILFEDKINFELTMIIAFIIITILAITYNRSLWIELDGHLLKTYKMFKESRVLDLRTCHYRVISANMVEIIEKDSKVKNLIPIGFLNRKNRVELINRIDDFSLNENRSNIMIQD